MLRKVLIGALGLMVLGGFAIGVVLIGREVILGPQTASAQAGRGRGVAVAEANRGGGQGQRVGEDVSTGVQGRGGGANHSEDTLSSEGGRMRGQGLGQGQGGGQGQAGSGSGAGRNEPQQRGQGNGNSPGEGNSPIVRNPSWEELSGTVVEYDGEMTVATVEREVLVGMGQSSYVAAQGFQAEKGDEVLVYGFYEDGEFKAGEVQNLSQGKTIVLRDQDGRPMWAGNGNGKNRT